MPVELQTISCFSGRVIGYMTLSSWNAEGGKKKILACPLVVEIYWTHCEPRFISFICSKLSVGYSGKYRLSLRTLPERWPFRLLHSPRQNN